MDWEFITHVLFNFGVPSVLLFLLLWRLNIFLTFLTAKFEVYNKELGIIGCGIRDLVQEIREVKEKLKN